MPLSHRRRFFAWSPPDGHSSRLSFFALKGLSPGACGVPASLLGTRSVTAMPMFSYVDWILLSYVALLRRMSPGFTCTPQVGRPVTFMEKSHDVGGPPPR